MATATKRQTQRAEERRSEPPARASSKPNRQAVRTTQDRQPREQQERDGQEQTGLAKINGEKLARGLGWFSIGLGLAEFLAPRGIARIAGVRGNTGLIRLFGLREIASGIGIFAQDARGERPALAIWSRVAGDALDLAALGAAFASPRSNKGRVAFATANVLAVTALDVLCAQQLSSSNDNATTGGTNQVKKSLIINRSPEELYQFWRDFENLPRFMKALESVSVTGDGHSHWVAKAPAGSTVEWDAEITEDRPGELIAWRSVEGSDVENSGSVRFENAPGGRGTIVKVQMNYKAPGGLIGEWVAKLTGDDPEQQAQEALRCFKQLMEVGEVVVSDGTVWDNGLLTQRPAQPVSSEELGRSRGAA
jgi:Predicted integral membrane protein